MDLDYNPCKLKFSSLSSMLELFRAGQCSQSAIRTGLNKLVLRRPTNGIGISHGYYITVQLDFCLRQIRAPCHSEASSKRELLSDPFHTIRFPLLITGWEFNHPHNRRFNPLPTHPPPSPSLLLPLPVTPSLPRACRTESHVQSRERVHFILMREISPSSAPSFFLSLHHAGTRGRWLHVHCSCFCFAHAPL